jgi:hypothetical protein
MGNKVTQRYEVCILGNLDKDIDSFHWVKYFIMRNDFYIVDYDHDLNICLSTSKGNVYIHISTTCGDDLSIYDLVVLLYPRNDINYRETMKREVTSKRCKSICTVYNGQDEETIRRIGIDVQDSHRQRGIGGFSLICSILLGEEISLLPYQGKGCLSW